MDIAEYRRLRELASQYPLDRCRQIARDVLDSPDVPDEDRICAAGILNALDAADHAQDLTIVEVSQLQLHASAAADAKRLWGRFGEQKPNEP